MEPYDLLEKVDGPDTFLAFVNELRSDRMSEVGRPIDAAGRGASGWENHTIEDFLEAALRWAEDSDFGARQDLKDASPWLLCATFLYCGKIYE